MDKDVLRLDVPVYDAVLVQNLEGLEQLLEVAQGLALRELLFGLENRIKSPSVAVVVHEVVVVGGLEHLEVLHDVGGVLEC